MLFERVTDLNMQAATVRRRRYGVIEVAGGSFQRVRLRPYPKLISLPEIRLADWLFHRRKQGDRCWVYYNQPWRFSNFLAVTYIVSTAGTSYQTFRRAVALLDEIARIKRSDALLCDLSNHRISDRLMRRWGWEPHASQRGHRHYIKRFYGRYPSNEPFVADDTTPLLRRGGQFDQEQAAVAAADG